MVGPAPRVVAVQGGRACRLASLLVRGPAAPHVLGDLDEAIERELARGVAPRRAACGFLALLLLGVACGNVGTLILARNAARSGEVAVRTALGASRPRILSQLFVESLVLALLAAGVGLGLGQLAMTRFESLDLWQEQLAFWIDFGLNRRTVAQALGVAVFCAVVVGLLPELRSTGRSEVMPGPYGAIEGWLPALAASAGVVLLVGLAACVVPTRRGLRIQPMEALRI